MSIINDALKKVQEDLRSKGSESARNPKPPHVKATKPMPQPQKPITETPPSSAPSAHKKTSIPRPRGIYVIISVIGIFIITGTAVLIHFGNQSSPKMNEPSQDRLSIETLRDSKGSHHSQNGLVLEGIMTIGGKKSVLINGEIFAEGETNGNLTIRKVFEDKVDVTYKRKSFTLYKKRLTEKTP